MLSLSILPLALILVETVRCSPLPMEGNKETPSMYYDGTISGGGGSSNSAGPESITLTISGLNTPRPYIEDAERLGITISYKDLRHDPEMIKEHIGHLLKHPKYLSKTLEDCQKEASLQSCLAEYHFNAFLPDGADVPPFIEGYDSSPLGKERFVGHPSNTKYFQDWIDRKWPLDLALTSEQKKERFNAEMTLQRALQAMRYLHKDPNAAIYHEPSGIIYLHPSYDLNEKDTDLADQRYHGGELPRLRFKDRLHFKTSDATKAAHRDQVEGGNVNGREMEEETSSEEEGEV